MGSLDWYKRYHDAALGGMMGLTLEERGAYNTVLDLIYSRDNSLLDDDYFIAGWCQVDVRVWKRIKKSLIEKKKLETSDGLLRNFRATCEVKFASQRLEQKVEAGRIGGYKSRRVHKENKDLVEANAKAQPPAELPAESKLVRVRVREEEERKSSVVARAGINTLEKTLSTIAEISNQPVKANPDISPIWKLVQRGFDIETEIIPVIRNRARTSRQGLIRSWAFFVQAIEDGRVQRPNSNGAAQQTIGESEWADRLKIARRMKSWDKNWGPFPNASDCFVPSNLVLPDDGQNWIVWDARK